jgi:hypothetical protein
MISKIPLSKQEYAMMIVMVADFLFRKIENNERMRPTMIKEL